MASFNNNKTIWNLATLKECLLHVYKCVKLKKKIFTLRVFKAEYYYFLDIPDSIVSNTM